MQLRGILPLSIIAVIAIAAMAQTNTISGIPYVIDGDTIIIHQTHIRLSGMDAPESDQTCTDSQGALYACGSLATSFLEEQIAGRPVICAPVDIDKYGRTVAFCSVNGIDLGDFMVRTGNAVDYPYFDPEGKYLAAEADARAAKRGMWAGSFDMPWDWRKQHK